MKLLNYTAHDINLYDGEKLKEVLPSVGVFRLKETNIIIGFLDEYPVYGKSYKLEDELPKEVPGVAYIVSSIAAQALKNKRNDIYVVNDTIRNASNQICGFKSFAKI